MTETNSPGEHHGPEVPEIVINGKPLSSMQSISVLVAVEHFLSRLGEPAFMLDRGRIGPVYSVELASVRDLMRHPQPARPAAGSREER